VLEKKIAALHPFLRGKPRHAWRTDDEFPDQVIIQETAIVSLLIPHVPNDLSSLEYGFDELKVDKKPKHYLTTGKDHFCLPVTALEYIRTVAY